MHAIVDDANVNEQKTNSGAKGLGFIPCTPLLFFWVSVKILVQALHCKPFAFHGTCNTVHHYTNIGELESIARRNVGCETKNQVQCVAL